MFIFQVYAEQKKAGDEDTMHLGVRLLAVREFLHAQLGVESAAGVGKTGADLSATEKAFRDKDVAKFMETLTPGAQNAIYAASFAWGYENAIKYVKNAMKIEEVKNADTPAEKSHAVVENITAQASDHSEKFAETSKFVWSFYNEDLKETQAQSGKSETITEKTSHKDTTKEEEQVRLSVPSTSAQAVAIGMAHGTQSPALLYCTSSWQQAEDLHLAQEMQVKKQELATLITVRNTAEQQAEGKILTPEKLASQLEQKKDSELSDDARQLALKRRDEVLDEYEKAQKQMERAIEKLDSFKEDEKEQVKKIATMLPREISQLVLSREKDLVKRKALRAQLVKWVAFCNGARDSLLKMPPSKLLKLAALSSLLKIGA